MPRPTRRAALLLALAAPLATPALAQPRGTARIIVGFPPGGSADTTARLMAERLRGGYAQNVIVDNRVGAAGRLAVEAVKAAEPDGNTILLTAASMLVIFPHLYSRATLRYDAFNDLLPVTPAGEFPFGMGVGPQAGSVGNLRDFIAWGRGRQEIPYGSAAAGSMLHFLGVQLAKAAGLSMTHIPYRGSAPAIQDLIGGRTACSFHPMVDLAAHAANPGGPVRLAAVSSEQRLARFPDAPTFAEQGYPQLTGTEWFGLFLPARTPAPVLEALHRAATEAATQPEYREAIARLEMRPYPLSPAEFGRRLKADYDKWGPIVAESGFKPEEG
jgi:tripartite-type tricarboxylate transporter receptor subunit TctC